MTIDDCVDPRILVAPLEAQSKTEVFRVLIEALGDDGAIADEDAALSAVLEREEASSTDLGNGIAIPHGIIPGVDRVIAAVGVSREPLPYESQSPVRVVVLLLGPADQPTMHVRALAHLARMLRGRDAVDRLIESREPHLFLIQLLEEEARRPLPR